MAFIDEIEFKVKAGKGGNGVVRWRHEKFIARGGPNGGNGGAGGNVLIRAVRNVHILSKYKHQKEFSAENGNDGEGGSRQGKYGEDLIIDLPIGSIVTNKNNNTVYRLETVNQSEVVALGGRGGFGNEHFKSSINTTPEKATNGVSGEEAILHIEVELFADLGLVGLPNAGKSSLLNAITNAEAKVGAYAFTTLDPNLGDFYGYIIADIPGIIEGASEGKGLGIKFLKHIKRTKKLLHLISCENGDKMFEVYTQIRSELEKFDKSMIEKDEIILLTKTDTISKEELSLRIKEFEKLGKPIYTMSLYDDASIEKFKKDLSHILENHQN